jgi:hypothetical protein
MKNSEIPYFADKVQNLYKLCFGKQISQKTKLNASLAQKLRQTSFWTLLLTIRDDVVLTVKPEHKDFKVKSPFFGDFLQAGIKLFQQAVTEKPSGCPDLSYRLVQLFSRCDAMPVLLELLRNQKYVAGKLKGIQHLITAEKFRKSLSLPEAATHQARFLQETFSTLSFPEFHLLTRQVFYQAWFSFQIYNSEDGTIQMQEDAVSRSLPTQIPDLRCQVGTLKDVSRALIWVECFLQNLAVYEGWRDH